MLLQLIFGLIVLRTRWGYDAFDWLGNRVTEYLDHTNAGAEFVFGANFMEHFFAFQVGQKFPNSKQQYFGFNLRKPVFRVSGNIVFQQDCTAIKTS